jgi:pyrimidine-nucleoside phosphorylase
VIAAEIIARKRDGHPLTEAEIQFFISEFLQEKIADYQMTALLMAVVCRGMSPAETTTLMQTYLHSGEVMSFPGDKKKFVDKHSTGGVGDKTSLIIGAIVAASGAHVPMISGRGLGHTGGTLDKLESIPGFQTKLSPEKFRQQVLELGCSFIGQTEKICPADRRIYALRDVTATVESLPLICASIISKKLAEGIGGLVLDVKFGNGAFMKKWEDAHALAKALKNLAMAGGVSTTAVLSDMNQPLGRYAGNSLEVHECIEIMKNQKFISDDGLDLYADTRALSIELSAILMAKAHSQSLDSARTSAIEILESGKALEMFRKICAAQGGDIDALPMPSASVEVRSTAAGIVSEFDTYRIGMLGIELGAGRRVSTDLIEPTCGFEFLVKIGSRVKQGDLLGRVWYKTKIDDMAQKISKCILISEENKNGKIQNIKQPKLIAEIMED